MSDTPVARFSVASFGRSAPICVAGHRGLVGSAVRRHLHDVNVGTREGATIAEISEMVTQGYEGRIEWDASKPDGTHAKVRVAS
jgi:hypothetical protein